MKILPQISVIIPTRNGQYFLEKYLTTISNKRNKKIEVIVVDNNSTDSTKKIALSYGCKYYNVNGKAPQVSLQRNIGAGKAKGTYLLFLDHDMELPNNFFKIIFSELNKFKSIDAWYIPEKVIAYNRIFTKVRNFENECSIGTVVSACRLIKRTCFLKTRSGFDIKLSGGPADWDMDIQLKILDCKLKTSRSYINHHEEGLSPIKYILKKGVYVKGIEAYIQKWKKNKKVYASIVNKQFDPIYRGITLFFERDNWKRTLLNLHLYLIMILLTLLKGAQYYIHSKRNE